MLHTSRQSVTKNSLNIYQVITSEGHNQPYLVCSNGNTVTSAVDMGVYSILQVHISLKSTIANTNFFFQRFHGLWYHRNKIMPSIVFHTKEILTRSHTNIEAIFLFFAFGTEGSWSKLYLPGACQQERHEWSSLPQRMMHQIIIWVAASP